MEAMVVLHGLRKIFNRNTIDEKVAIDGIELEVGGGEFITVIGSNGAGKTTLLNLIAGTQSERIPGLENVHAFASRFTEEPGGTIFAVIALNQRDVGDSSRRFYYDSLFD